MKELSQEISEVIEKLKKETELDELVGYTVHTSENLPDMSKVLHIFNEDVVEYHNFPIQDNNGYVGTYSKPIKMNVTKFLVGLKKEDSLKYYSYELDKLRSKTDDLSKDKQDLKIRLSNTEESLAKANSRLELNLKELTKLREDDKIYIERYENLEKDLLKLRKALGDLKIKEILED